jgi:hypothetical protein
MVHLDHLDQISKERLEQTLEKLLKQIPKELLRDGTREIKQIPKERLSKTEVTALKTRYDLIEETLESIEKRLKQIKIDDQSTPGYKPLKRSLQILEEELFKVSNELARRAELARRWAPKLRMFINGEVTKKDFEKNANLDKGDPNKKDCITCMNHAMRNLIGSKQKVGSTVERTMAKMQRSGHAGVARVIKFDTEDGPPKKLRESVWEAVIKMVGGDVGWSVFGMSLMDGYHSVTLTLDNREPQDPHIYWSDQWQERGGWLEYSGSELDAEITGFTKKFWGSEFDEKDIGYNTRVTLWRLNP